MNHSIHRASRRAPHALAAALALALAGVAEPAGAAGHANRAAHPGAAPHANSALAQSFGDFSHLRTAFAHAAAARAAAVMPSRAPMMRRVQSLGDSGPGSLRETLADAVDGDVIDLGDLRGRITLVRSLTTSANVTINGPGRDLLTIDGAQHGRVITSNGSLTLSNVSITGGAVINGSSAPTGGCLFVQGDLQIRHATISGCSLGDESTSAAYGGAIAVGGSIDAKYTTISDSTVTANQAAAGGGLLSMNGGPLLMSTISGNHVNQVLAPADAAPSATPNFFGAGGGAMALNSTSPLYLLGSNVTGNTVTAVGGTYLNASTSTLVTVPGDGMAGGVVTQMLLMGGATISGNTLDVSGAAYGGGVVLLPPPLPPPPVAAPAARPRMIPFSLAGAIPDGTSGSNAKYSTIADNSATSSGDAAVGGGVASQGALTIAASAIANNSAHGGGASSSSGGGIASMPGSTLLVQSSTISGNAALSDDADGYAWGGGIAMWYGMPLQMTDSTVSGNQSTAPAGSYSGGIAASVVQIANSTVTLNTASGHGGGIVLYDAASAKEISSTIIAGNTATDMPAGADLYSPDNPSIAGDHNLVIAGSGVTWATEVPITTDPQLQALAFNGGPTMTHALPVGSVAVDAGTNAASLTTDQRGYARVVGPNADIGAYELDTDRIFTNGFDAQLGGP